MGFFSEAYRDHDFMLGRRNCQWFLQSAFTLPRTNKRLFDKTWSPKARQRYASKMNPDHLQIIPCVGPCEVEEPLSDWPARKFAYGDDVKALAEKRADRFVSEAFARISGQKDGGSWWDRLKSAGKRAYLRPLESAIVKQIKDATQDEVEGAVREIDRRFQA